MGMVRKKECLWPSTLDFLYTSIGSGCGSVALWVEEGIIHSASYPDLYPKNLRCHWFIHTPEKHIIKVSSE